MTEHASQERAGRAELGGSVTRRLLPVDPTCRSVTSMPPVNTTTGQPGRSQAKATASPVGGAIPFVMLYTVKPVLLPRGQYGSCGS